jgi:hypothetical protein
MLRIALHTAEAQRRDERSYFGQAVNRCARLGAVAHGGQVVLSRTTHDLVLGRLPDRAELVDLGIHRLRDLGRPEHVFGLVHPELPAAFPPLRSLDTMPNNLPGELTSFVGRSAELAQIGTSLEQARLFTLTGAGGCGKTRLALQVAADAMDRHPDGVWWVELARLEHSALLAAAVSTAADLREVPGRAVLDTLVEHLRGRRVLVALDNCNAPAVAQICHDLDGIPLAIELAAARVRMLAPEQIARALSDASTCSPASPHGNAAPPNPAGLD